MLKLINPIPYFPLNSQPHDYKYVEPRAMLCTSFKLISKKLKKSFLDVLLHEISLHLSLYLSLNSSQLLNFW